MDIQLSKGQFFMAEPKYSLETRLAVVNYYLSGKGGAKSTADFFGALRARLFDVGSEPGNYTILMVSPGKMTAILLNFGKLSSGRHSVKNLRCAKLQHGLISQMKVFGTGLMSTKPQARKDF